MPRGLRILSFFGAVAFLACNLGISDVGLLSTVPEAEYRYPWVFGVLIGVASLQPFCDIVARIFEWWRKDSNDSEESQDLQAAQTPEVPRSQFSQTAPSPEISRDPPSVQIAMAPETAQTSQSSHKLPALRAAQAPEVSRASQSAQGPPAPEISRVSISSPTALTPEVSPASQSSQNAETPEVERVSISSRTALAPDVSLADEKISYWDTTRLMCRHVSLVVLVPIVFFVPAILRDGAHVVRIPVSFVAACCICEGARRKGFNSLHHVALICAAYCTPIAPEFNLGLWFTIYVSSVGLLAISLWFGVDEPRGGLVSSEQPPKKSALKKALSNDIVKVVQRLGWPYKVAFIAIHVGLAFLIGGLMHLSLKNARLRNDTVSTLAVFLLFLFGMLSALLVGYFPKVDRIVCGKSVAAATALALLTSLDAVLKKASDSDVGKILPAEWFTENPWLGVVVYVLVLLSAPISIMKDTPEPAKDKAKGSDEYYNDLADKADSQRSAFYRYVGQWMKAKRYWRLKNRVMEAKRYWRLKNRAMKAKRYWRRKNRVMDPEQQVESSGGGDSRATETIELNDLTSRGRRE